MGNKVTFSVKVSHVKFLTQCQCLLDKQKAAVESAAANSLGYFLELLVMR